jgi:hypothetical protein
MNAFLQRWIGLWLASGALLFPVEAQVAHGAATREYRQKTKMIATFLKNCRWLQEDKKSQRADELRLVFGVFESDEMFLALREELHGQKIDGWPVDVRLLATKGEMASCHAVFIGRSESPRMRAVLRNVWKKGVLTIGENEGFLASGGMVEFTGVAPRLRYRIGIPALRREKIELGGFVLRSAERKGKEKVRFAEQRLAESPRP